MERKGYSDTLLKWRRAAIAALLTVLLTVQAVPVFGVDEEEEIPAGAAVTEEPAESLKEEEPVLVEEEPAEEPAPAEIEEEPAEEEPAAEEESTADAIAEEEEPPVEEPWAMAPPVIVARTPTTIRIRFDAVEGASGYEIWVERDGKSKLKKTTTATDTKIISLIPGTSYTIRVRPYIRVEGIRIPFMESAVEGKTAYMKRITPKTATNYHAVILTWDGQEEAAGYKIMKKKGGTYKTIATVQGLTYTDTGLTAGNTYSYIVRPYVKVAGKVYNGPVGTAVSAVPLPVSATILSIRSGSQELTVNWNRIAGATGYTLYRSASPEGPFDPVVDVNALSYTDKGLEVNTTYWYRVEPYRTVKGKKVYGSFKNTAHKKTSNLKALKILFVGNSFNQDAVAYLPPILDPLLPEYDVTYGVCYTGSATLKQHVEWFEQGKPYTVFNYWDSESTKWKRYSSASAKTLKQVLDMEDWDLILYQGNSAEATTDEGIAAMVENAVSLQGVLEANAVEPFDLAWIELMAPVAGEVMYQRICLAVQAAVTRLPVRTTIPVGTAFWTARQDPELASLGDSGYDDMMYSDRVHMQAGIPALLAAYTTAASVLEYLGYDPALLEDACWEPTQENVVQINASNGAGGGMTHGDVRGVTPENMQKVKEIAIDTVIDMP